MSVESTLVFDGIPFEKVVVAGSDKLKAAVASAKKITASKAPAMLKGKVTGDVYRLNVGTHTPVFVTYADYNTYTLYMSRSVYKVVQLLV